MPKALTKIGSKKSRPFESAIDDLLKVARNTWKRETDKKKSQPEEGW